MGRPRRPAFSAVVAAAAAAVRAGTDPVVGGDVCDSLRQRRSRAAHCLRISFVVRHSHQLEAHNYTGGGNHAILQIIATVPHGQHFPIAVFTCGVTDRSKRTAVVFFFLLSFSH